MFCTPIKLPANPLKAYVSKNLSRWPAKIDFPDSRAEGQEASRGSCSVHSWRWLANTYRALLLFVLSVDLKRARIWVKIMALNSTFNAKLSSLTYDNEAY